MKHRRTICVGCGRQWAARPDVPSDAPCLLCGSEQLVTVDVRNALDWQGMAVATAPDPIPAIASAVPSRLLGYEGIPEFA